MKANADITIYNKYIDSRDEKYQRTVVSSVYWQNIRAASQWRNGGDIAANKVAIYIPLSSGDDYLEPKAWQAAKTGKFTLQEGDYIVHGEVTDEITSSFTVSDLKAKYDDVLAIAEVDPHLYGGLKHWKVTAK